MACSRDGVHEELWLVGLVGLVWFGWVGLGWLGCLCWFSLGWFRLAWCGLVWSGLVWSGLVWFGLVFPDPTRSNAPNFGHLGDILGFMRAILCNLPPPRGASWAALGQSWRHLRPYQDHLGPSRKYNECSLGSTM